MLSEKEHRTSHTTSSYKYLWRRGS